MRHSKQESLFGGRWNSRPATERSTSNRDDEVECQLRSNQGGASSFSSRAAEEERRRVLEERHRISHFRGLRPATSRSGQWHLSSEVNVRPSRSPFPDAEGEDSASAQRSRLPLQQQQCERDAGIRERRRWFSQDERFSGSRISSQSSRGFDEGAARFYSTDDTAPWHLHPSSSSETARRQCQRPFSSSIGETSFLPRRSIHTSSHHPGSSRFDPSRRAASFSSHPSSFQASPCSYSGTFLQSVARCAGNEAAACVRRFAEELDLSLPKADPDNPWGDARAEALRRLENWARSATALYVQQGRSGAEAAAAVIAEFRQVLRRQHEAAAIAASTQKAKQEGQRLTTEEEKKPEFRKECKGRPFQREAVERQVERTDEKHQLKTEENIEFQRDNEQQQFESEDDNMEIEDDDDIHESGKEDVKQQVNGELAQEQDQLEREGDQTQQHAGHEKYNQEQEPQTPLEGGGEKYEVEVKNQNQELERGDEKQQLEKEEEKRKLQGGEEEQRMGQEEEYRALEEGSEKEPLERGDEKQQLEREEEKRKLQGGEEEQRIRRDDGKKQMKGEGETHPLETEDDTHELEIEARNEEFDSETQQLEREDEEKQFESEEKKDALGREDAQQKVETEEKSERSDENQQPVNRVETVLSADEVQTRRCSFGSLRQETESDSETTSRTQRVVSDHPEDVVTCEDDSRDKHEQSDSDSTSQTPQVATLQGVDSSTPCREDAESKVAETVESFEPDSASRKDGASLDKVHAHEKPLALEILDSSVSSSASPQPRPPSQAFAEQRRKTGTLKKPQSSSSSQAEKKPKSPKAGHASKERRKTLHARVSYEKPPTDAATEPPSGETDSSLEALLSEAGVRLTRTMLRQLQMPASVDLATSGRAASSSRGPKRKAQKAVSSLNEASESKAGDPISAKEPLHSVPSQNKENEAPVEAEDELRIHPVAEQTPLPSAVVAAPVSLEEEGQSTPGASEAGPCDDRLQMENERSSSRELKEAVDRSEIDPVGESKLKETSVDTEEAAAPIDSQRKDGTETQKVEASSESTAEGVLSASSAVAPGASSAEKNSRKKTEKPRGDTRVPRELWRLIQDNFAFTSSNRRTLERRGTGVLAEAKGGDNVSAISEGTPCPLVVSEPSTAMQEETQVDASEASEALVEKPETETKPDVEIGTPSPSFSIEKRQTETPCAEEEPVASPSVSSGRLDESVVSSKTSRRKTLGAGDGCGFNLPELGGEEAQLGVLVSDAGLRLTRTLLKTLQDPSAAASARSQSPPTRTAASSHAPRSLRPAPAKTPAAEEASRDSMGVKLAPRDDRHAFSFVGYRVRVVRFWKERQNVESFDWVEGVIKYYTPKYRMIFVHFLLNPAKTDVASPSNAPDLSLKGGGLLPFFSPEETHRCWFSITADVIRLASTEPVWKRCDVPPPLLTPSERAAGQVQDKLLEGREIRGQAALCFDKTVSSSREASPLQTNTEERSAEGTKEKLCGACSAPVCRVVVPGLPLEASAFCRGLSTEDIRRSIPSSVSSDTLPCPSSGQSLQNLFWGLRCGRCRRVFHASCVKPAHRRIPPPTMQATALCLEASAHRRLVAEREAAIAQHEAEKAAASQGLSPRQRKGTRSSVGGLGGVESGARGMGHRHPEMFSSPDLPPATCSQQQGDDGFFEQTEDSAEDGTSWPIAATSVSFDASRKAYVASWVLPAAAKPPSSANSLFATFRRQAETRVVRRSFALSKFCTPALAFCRAKTALLTRQGKVTWQATAQLGAEAPEELSSTFDTVEILNSDFSAESPLSQNGCNLVETKRQRRCLSSVLDESSEQDATGGGELGSCWSSRSRLLAVKSPVSSPVQKWRVRLFPNPRETFGLEVGGAHERGRWGPWLCRDCAQCTYCCEPITLPLTTLRSSSSGKLNDGLYEAVVNCHCCNVFAHGACCYPPVVAVRGDVPYRCDSCRRCASCDYVDLYWPEHANWDPSSYELCLHCRRSVDNGEFCFVCLKTWTAVGGSQTGGEGDGPCVELGSEGAVETWVQCEGCRGWVHRRCDNYLATQSLEEQALKSLKYRCPPCRSPSSSLRYERVVSELLSFDRTGDFSFLPDASYSLYWRVISHPMSLSTIRSKVRRKAYSDNSHLDFLKDLALLVQNAKTLHMPNTRQYKAAAALQRKANELLAGVLELKVRDPLSLVDAHDELRVAPAKRAVCADTPGAAEGPSLLLGSQATTPQRFSLRRQSQQPSSSEVDADSSEGFRSDRAALKRGGAKGFFAQSGIRSGSSPKSTHLSVSKLLSLSTAAIRAVVQLFEDQSRLVGEASNQRSPPVASVSCAGPPPTLQWSFTGDTSEDLPHEPLLRVNAVSDLPVRETLLAPCPPRPASQAYILNLPNAAAEAAECLSLREKEPLLEASCSKAEGPTAPPEGLAGPHCKTQRRKRRRAGGDAAGSVSSGAEGGVLRVMEEKGSMAPDSIEAAEARTAFGAIALPLAPPSVASSTVVFPSLSEDSGFAFLKAMQSLYGRARHSTAPSDFKDSFLWMESCAVCGGLDEASSFCFCRTCGQAVHASCLGALSSLWLHSNSGLSNVLSLGDVSCAECLVCRECKTAAPCASPLEAKNVALLETAADAGLIPRWTVSACAKMGFLLDGPSGRYRQVLHEFLSWRPLVPQALQIRAVERRSRRRRALEALQTATVFSSSLFHVWRCSACGEGVHALCLQKNPDDSAFLSADVPALSFGEGSFQVRQSPCASQCLSSELQLDFGKGLYRRQGGGSCFGGAPERRRSRTYRRGESFPPALTGQSQEGLISSFSGCAYSQQNVPTRCEAPVPLQDGRSVLPSQSFQAESGGFPLPRGPQSVWLADKDSVSQRPDTTPCCGNELPALACSQTEASLAIPVQQETIPLLQETMQPISPFEAQSCGFGIHLPSQSLDAECMSNVMMAPNLDATPIRSLPQSPPLENACDQGNAASSALCAPNTPVSSPSENVVLDATSTTFISEESLHAQAPPEEPMTQHPLWVVSDSRSVDPSVQPAIQSSASLFASPLTSQVSLVGTDRAAVQPEFVSATLPVPPFAATEHPLPPAQLTGMTVPSGIRQSAKRVRSAVGVSPLPSQSGHVSAGRPGSAVSFARPPTQQSLRVSSQTSSSFLPKCRWIPSFDAYLSLCCPACADESTRPATGTSMAQIKAELSLEALQRRVLGIRQKGREEVAAKEAVFAQLTKRNSAGTSVVQLFRCALCSCLELSTKKKKSGSAPLQGYFQEKSNEAAVLPVFSLKGTERLCAECTDAAKVGATGVLEAPNSQLQNQTSMAALKANFEVLLLRCVEPYLISSQTCKLSGAAIGRTCVSSETLSPHCAAAVSDLAAIFASDVWQSLHGDDLNVQPQSAAPHALRGLCLEFVIFVLAESPVDGGFARLAIQFLRRFRPSAEEEKLLLPTKSKTELIDDLVRICKAFAASKRGESFAVGGGDVACSVARNEERLLPVLAERIELWYSVASAAGALLKTPVYPIPSLLVRFAAIGVEEEEKALEETPLSVQSDDRVCLLCGGKRNRLFLGPLVPVFSAWVHAQCALWAAPESLLPQVASEELLFHVDGGDFVPSEEAVLSEQGKYAAPFSPLPPHLPPVVLPAAVILKAASDASQFLCEFCGLNGAFVRCGSDLGRREMEREDGCSALRRTERRGSWGCTTRAHLRCLLRSAANWNGNGERDPPQSASAPCVFFSLRRFYCMRCSGWSLPTHAETDARAEQQLRPFSSRHFAGLADLCKRATIDPLLFGVEGLSGGVAFSLLRFLRQSVCVSPLVSPSVGGVNPQASCGFPKASAHLPKSVRNQPAVEELASLFQKLEDTLAEETKSEGGLPFFPSLSLSLGGRSFSLALPFDAARKLQQIGSRHSLLRCGAVSVLSFGCPLLIGPSRRNLHPVGFAAVRRFWRLAPPAEVHSSNCPFRNQGVESYCLLHASSSVRRWDRASYLCGVSARRGQLVYTIDLLESSSAESSETALCDACVVGWRVTAADSLEEAVTNFITRLRLQVQEVALRAGLSLSASLEDGASLQIDGEAFFGLNLKFVQRQAREMLLAAWRTKAVLELQRLAPLRDPTKEGGAWSRTGVFAPPQSEAASSRSSFCEPVDLQSSAIPEGEEVFFERVLGRDKVEAAVSTEISPQGFVGGAGLGSALAVTGGGSVSRGSSSSRFRAQERRGFKQMPPAMLYRLLQSRDLETRLAVLPSNIHGLGLFTRVPLSEGEPVVEYVGELIRNVVSDKREKVNEMERGGDGSCYMFRLDDSWVIDATRKGNVSRFINHSCAANCSCRILVCENGKSHIIIFAKEYVPAGAEITYDYQFGIEAETEKLVCLCGAPGCLGRMN